MKLAEALKIIEKDEFIKAEKGFYILFDTPEDRNEFFPDKFEGDELLKTPEIAWSLAERLSKVSTGYMNIQIRDQDGNYPLGYEYKILNPCKR